MRLNAQTDFSLRMLMFLAAKGGGPATIQEVSSRMGLSQAHMMKVAAKLVSKGLLVSSRGRFGGLSLSREAGEITVEEVVRAIEPDFALVQCFDPERSACSIQPACPLQHVLGAALEAFFAEMRPVTLAQLAHAESGALLQLMGLESRTVGAVPLGGA